MKGSGSMQSRMAWGVVVSFLVLILIAGVIGAQQKMGKDTRAVSRGN